MSDIDNLLDGTLDDLEDLPEYLVFPPGAHKVGSSLSLKEINKSQAVELRLKLIQTLELAEPTKDKEPTVGSVSSMLFMLDNEFGRGKFKAVASVLGEALGLSNLREIIEQTTDVECLVITSIRKDKNDTSKEYLNIKEFQVA